MKLTENFNLDEFACKDGTQVPARYMQNVRTLAAQLQVLRDFFGIPVAIGSGYRTKEHNKAQKGSPKSQHLTASAADIRIARKTPVQVAAAIEKLVKAKRMKEGGIGIYDGFVHYDIRGTKARWTL